MNRKNLILLGLLTMIVTNVLFGESIARVMKFNGDVSLKRLGSEEFTEAVTLGVAVNNGDAIKVGSPGFAVVIFIDDRSIIKVRENTQFQFTDSENTRTIDIEFGTILNDVKKEGRTKTFRVETPVSVASVKGTQFAAVVDPSGVDQFYGKEGNFEVFNQISGETVNVGPGQKAVSNAMGNLMQAPASPSEYPQDPEGETVEEPVEEVPEEEIEEEVEEPSEPGLAEEPGVEPEPAVEPVEEAPVEEPPMEEPPAEEPQAEAPKPFGMGAGIGSVTIDGVLYNQLAFRPEFSFGKLGIGLDVVVYIDNEGNFRKDEWDEATDIVDKFMYIRWAEKTDPFWFKVGALEGVTLGYGGLLRGYSNMMEFPTVRPVGINTGVNMGPIGTEIFLANAKDFSRGGTLIGLRGTYRVSDGFPLTVGVNFVTDVNQFSGLKNSDDDEKGYPDIFDAFPDDEFTLPDYYPDGAFDHSPGDVLKGKNYAMDSDNDGIPDELDFDRDGDGLTDFYPDDPTKEFELSYELDKEPFSVRENKATATGFAFDIGYPLLKKEMFSLDVYSEYNVLTFPKVVNIGRLEDRSGTGITVPGIKASLFKLLQMRVEYRIKQGYYVTEFFDQGYDLNRVVPIYLPDETIVKTKDMLLFEDPLSKTDSKGWFGSASMSLFNLGSFSASYANMVADTIEFNSFYAQVSLNADNIPKLSTASAYYLRNNDTNPFDFGNPSVNTVLGYRMGYEISSGVSLIWDFRQFYRDDGTGTGNLIPVKQTTIETAFAF